MTKSTVRKNSLSLALFTSMFKVSLGLISYPLFLKFLDAFDLSIYLLFISTISFVELLDFNFFANLIRYFSYADAGVNHLNISNIEIQNNVDGQHNLPSDLFVMAKYYYRYMCLLAFILFGVGFSIYLFYFTRLHHKSYLYYEINWLFYMSSMLLGVYFTYLSPALIGSGHIDKVNRVLLISKVVAVIIQSGLVYYIGLPAIVIGALISMVIERVLLINLVKTRLDFPQNVKLDKQKFYVLLKQFWHTNYKLALMGTAYIIIMRFKFFVAGFVIYDASKLAEFLFTLQIFSIIYTIATVPISNNYSDMSVYFISNKPKLVEIFIKQNRISLSIIFIISVCIILFGNILTDVINAKHTFLPIQYLLLTAMIYIFEVQLSNNVNSLIIQNQLDVYKSYLITSAGLIILAILFCFVFHLQIWGLLLSQLLAQSLYNYWYWVRYNLQTYSISLKSYLLSLLSYRKIELS